MSVSSFLVTTMQEHLHTALPYATVVSAGLWTLVYHRFAEKAMWLVLPRAEYEKLREKRRTDSGLDRMCRANAVAMVHAMCTVPLAFLCFIPDGPLRDDKVNGCTHLALFLCWVMCGYFIWDVQICIRNLKEYGIAFLIHAILSFLGLYMQAAAGEGAMFWYLTVFMASELSTPFLHIRWYLTKSGATATRYFRAMNVLFILSFVLYRLVFIEVYAFAPYLKLQSQFTASTIGYYRWWIVTIFIGAWCILNYYWGILLLKSQWKHWFGVRKRATA